MKFKDRIKSYKFWVALSASIVILLQALGEAFNFSISESIINGITVGFCGVLVVLGVIEKPNDESKNNNNINEEKNEVNAKQIPLRKTKSNKENQVKENQINEVNDKAI